MARVLIKTIQDIKEGDTFSIGAVLSSMLDETQFQAQMGTGWILMDGRNVTGSQYHTITGNLNVPDARGIALRGKNNTRSDGNENPAGELALGTFESDEMQGHHHSQTFNTDVCRDQFAGAGHYATGTHGERYVQAVTDPITDGVNGAPRTGLETRMKNITVNHFIRIN